MDRRALRDQVARVEVVAPDRLRVWAQAVFEREGMRHDDALIMADHFVWAELRGNSWFGFRRLPTYVRRLRRGAPDPGAEVTLVTDRAAFALLDGGGMWGQVAGARAMDLAVEKARSAGSAVVVVRNTTSAGVLGYYPGLAAEQGMIGLAINNSPPLQAPTGSAARAIGNQAYAVGTPAGRHAPLILDTATSAMSLAGIYEAERRGEALPSEVAIDAHGRVTTDPAEALGGVLLPAGGHHGYGLALIWEVFTGVLGGHERFASTLAMPDDGGPADHVTMCLLAIDPAAALAYDRYLARVDELIDQMHAAVPVDGVSRVRVPGERAEAIAEQRRRQGVPLPHDTIEKLRALANELELPLP